MKSLTPNPSPKSEGNFKGEGRYLMREGILYIICTEVSEVKEEVKNGN